MLRFEIGEGYCGQLAPCGAERHGQAAAVRRAVPAAFGPPRAITRIFVRGPIFDRLGRSVPSASPPALGVVAWLFILAGNPWLVRAGVVLWAVASRWLAPRECPRRPRAAGPGARFSVVASIGYYFSPAGPPAIRLARPVVACATPCGAIVALFLAACAAPLFRPRPPPSVTPRAPAVPDPHTPPP